MTFDTAVLVDFCVGRYPYFPAAVKLLDMAARNKTEALTSASGLKDVFYFARMGEGEIKGREIISDLMKLIGICNVNRAMWEEALHSPLSNTEDALQVACAIHHGAGFLVTRNIRDYKKVKGIQVVPPPALAAILDQRYQSK